MLNLLIDKHLHRYDQQYLRNEGMVMTTFAGQFKSEVSRLAKREVKSEVQTLKSASAQYRADIAALKRRVVVLESQLKKLMKAGGKQTDAVEQLSDEKSLRFRMDGFITLRKKLGLTAAQMASLIGVSAQSVYHWEAGKSRPRASQLPAIAALRKMRKAEILGKLEA
jgi:DNA-binding XRE family transcriptional regulator